MKIFIKILIVISYIVFVISFVWCIYISTQNWNIKLTQEERFLLSWKQSVALVISAILINIFSKKR